MFYIPGQVSQSRAIDLSTLERLCCTNVQVYTGYVRSRITIAGPAQCFLRSPLRALTDVIVPCSSLPYKLRRVSLWFRPRRLE